MVTDTDESYYWTELTCDLSCMCSILCVIIGLLKLSLELDQKRDRENVFFIGLFSTICSFQIKFSPVTTYHYICNIICGVGIVLSVTGIAVDLIICSLSGSHREESHKKVMYYGGTLCFLMNIVKALVWACESFF